MKKRLVKAFCPILILFQFIWTTINRVKFPDSFQFFMLLLGFHNSKLLAYIKNVRSLLRTWEGTSVNTKCTRFNCAPRRKSSWVWKSWFQKFKYDKWFFLFRIIWLSSYLSFIPYIYKIIQFSLFIIFKVSKLNTIVFLILFIQVSVNFLSRYHSMFV